MATRRCPCRKTLAWRRVMDTVLVAAAGPSAGGQHSISQRLTRHCVMLAMPPPSEAMLRSICTAVLGGFLGASFTPGVFMNVTLGACLNVSAQHVRQCEHMHVGLAALGLLYMHGSARRLLLGSICCEGFPSFAVRLAATRQLACCHLVTKCSTWRRH